MSNKRRAPKKEFEDRVPKDKRTGSNRKFKDDRPSDKQNDSKWYTRNAQNVLDAGRLSFNVATGSPVIFNNDNQDINGYSASDYRLPGVAALQFIPTYGKADTATDPLNVASRSIFSNIRKVLSGWPNYDPNDLMLYLMAMDNIYMLYQHCCRIYGLCTVYSRYNRYLPTELLKAMHLDPYNTVSNLADIRAKLNVIVAKIGSICVPGTFPLFLRHMWMTSGVYADSPSPKAQYYIFIPRTVGRYNETTSETGGYLEAVNLWENWDSIITYNSLISTLETMVDRVIASQDCGVISGDIRKAFGDKLFTLAPISDDYTVIPVYSEEVLRQIHNTTIIDGYRQSYHYQEGKLMYQDMDENILKSGITFKVDSPAYAGNRIFTGSDENPSPEEVMVNSRLMVTGTTVPDPEYVGTGNDPKPYIFTPTSVGTEVVIGLNLYGGGTKSTSQVNWNSWNYLSFVNRFDATSNVSGNLRKFSFNYAILEHFNYHPRVGVAELGADSEGNVTYSSVLQYQDIDNYTVVDDNILYGLHQAALLSLFDIPI